MRKQFLELYETHYEQVVAFLLSYGAALAEAEDAAQEAFLDAWQLIATCRWHTVTYPAAWTRAVALRRYRRPPGPRRSPLVALTPPEQLPRRPLQAADTGELTTQALYVIQVLRRLDEKSRAVMAFHIDGFSAVETAAALGIDDQEVRNLRKRGRSHLARALAEAHAQEGGTAK
ncbi:sigma-70 family RNA polymerase sigma factor [Actinomadura sp. 3N407]|uniref:sigma-70 family RNA polymerase sigma factor n=1 Tax=Actinomadura sp. 3N407 TaxID=3457423 RepID=UPI003FCEE2D1